MFTHGTRKRPMKKLHLEDLTVESFDTSSATPARGTVQGHDHSDPSNCINSGFCTCYGQPCNTFTCQCDSGAEPDTCPYSCAMSCPNSCDSCQATCISCMATCEGYAGCTYPNICIE
jgi:hypothetical protein